MFKFGTIDFGALRLDLKAKGGVLVNKFGHQELNIQSASLARDLFRKATQKRHAPLVAFLRSGLRREVMIIANGEAWRKTHDALAPFFTHGRVNETYAPIIDAVAAATCSTIATGSDGTIAIEIERVMRTALARVMGFVVFGRVLTEAEAERLEQDLETVTRKPDRGAHSAINVAMAFVLRRIGLARNQKILFSNTRNRAISSLLDWIGEVIDQQIAGGGESPLIDALEQRYASCDPRDRKVRVVAECAMLFIAAIETTAAALTFTFAEFGQDADLSRQAAEEARAFDPADMRDIAKACPHLNAVLQETLRRHPIVPTMLRDAAEAIELDAETEEKIGAARIIVARNPKIVARRGATLRYFPLQNKPAELRSATVRLSFQRRAARSLRTLRHRAANVPGAQHGHDRILDATYRDIAAFRHFADSVRNADPGGAQCGFHQPPGRRHREIARPLSLSCAHFYRAGLFTRDGSRGRQPRTLTAGSKRDPAQKPSNSL
jgi:cytochrome P450